MTHGRSNIDDSTVPPTTHHRHKRSAHQERRRQVAIEDLIPFIESEIDQRLADIDAGIIDEYVHMSEACLNLFLHAADLRLLRYINYEYVRLRSKLRRFRSGIVQPLLITPNQCQRRAFATEFQRDGFADAAASSRNHGETTV